MLRLGSTAQPPLHGLQQLPTAAPRRRRVRRLPPDCAIEEGLLPPVLVPGQRRRQGSDADPAALPRAGTPPPAVRRQDAAPETSKRSATPPASAASNPQSPHRN